MTIFLYFRHNNNFPYKSKQSLSSNIKYLSPGIISEKSKDLEKNPKIMSGPKKPIGIRIRILGIIRIFLKNWLHHFHAFIEI